MIKDIISGFVSLFRPTNDADLEDRRQVIRLRCRFNVYVIDLKDISTGTVLDMGLRGLRLECKKPVKKGMRLSLVYRGAVGQKPKVTLAQLEADRQAAIESGVRCKVIWTNKNRASRLTQVGVSYADTPERMSQSWIKRILKEIGFDEGAIFQRRNVIRVVSAIPCSVNSGHNNWRGRAVNMGAGGILYQDNKQIPEGTVIKIQVGPYNKLEPLEAAGEIVTKRYDAISDTWLHGVKFRAMDEDQVDLLGRYVVTLLKEHTA